MPSVSRQPWRLLLVDDHPVLRAGLRALLVAQSDFDVVAEAESGEHAVLLARDVRPDLVVLDFALPGINGIETVRRLKREAPLARVLALSVHDEPAIVRDLVEAGADGYLLKRSACDELVRAVHRVAQGMAYLDPGLSPQSARPDSRRGPPGSARGEALSDREAEVSRLLALGLTMKEIAQQLNLSPRTLETYRARAMEKLGLKNRAELIRCALRLGWLAED